MARPDFTDMSPEQFGRPTGQLVSEQQYTPEQQELYEQLLSGVGLFGASIALPAVGAALTGLGFVQTGKKIAEGRDLDQWDAINVFGPLAGAGLGAALKRFVPMIKALRAKGSVQEAAEATAQLDRSLAAAALKGKAGTPQARLFLRDKGMKRQALDQPAGILDGQRFPRGRMEQGQATTQQGLTAQEPSWMFGPKTRTGPAPGGAPAESLPQTFWPTARPGSIATSPGALTAHDVDLGLGQMLGRAPRSVPSGAAAVPAGRAPQAPLRAPSPRFQGDQSLPGPSDPMGFGGGGLPSVPLRGAPRPAGMHPQQLGLPSPSAREALGRGLPLAQPNVTRPLQAKPFSGDPTMLKPADPRSFGAAGSWPRGSAPRGTGTAFERPPVADTHIPDTGIQVMRPPSNLKSPYRVSGGQGPASSLVSGRSSPHQLPGRPPTAPHSPGLQTPQGGVPIFQGQGSSRPQAPGTATMPGRLAQPYAPAGKPRVRMESDDFGLPKRPVDPVTKAGGWPTGRFPVREESVSIPDPRTRAMSTVDDMAKEVTQIAGRKKKMGKVGKGLLAGTAGMAGAEMMGDWTGEEGPAGGLGERIASQIAQARRPGAVSPKAPPTVDEMAKQAVGAAGYGAYKIKSGDNIQDLVNELAKSPKDRITLKNQIIELNPEIGERGDVIKAGASLTLPTATQAARLEASDAMRGIRKTRLKKRKDKGVGRAAVAAAEDPSSAIKQKRRRLYEESQPGSEVENFINAASPRPGRLERLYPHASPMEQGGRVWYQYGGGVGSTDTVKAMLTPGEHVIDRPNADYVRRNPGDMSNLRRLADDIRRGSPSRPPRYFS